MWNFACLQQSAVTSVCLCHSSLLLHFCFVTAFVSGESVAMGKRKGKKRL